MTATLSPPTGPSADPPSGPTPVATAVSPPRAEPVAAPSAAAATVAEPAGTVRPSPSPSPSPSSATVADAPPSTDHVPGGPAAEVAACPVCGFLADQVTRRNAARCLRTLGNRWYELVAGLDRDPRRADWVHQAPAGWPPVLHGAAEVAAALAAAHRDLVSLAVDLEPLLAGRAAPPAGADPGPVTPVLRRLTHAAELLAVAVDRFPSVRWRAIGWRDGAPVRAWDVVLGVVHDATHRLRVAGQVVELFEIAAAEAANPVIEPSAPGAPVMRGLPGRAMVLAEEGAPDAVERLVEAAAGERERLEAARRDLTTLLRHTVDDGAATAALRLVNRAIKVVGWTPRLEPEPRSAGQAGWCSCPRPHAPGDPRAACAVGHRNR